MTHPRRPIRLLALCVGIALLSTRGISTKAADAVLLRDVFVSDSAEGKLPTLNTGDTVPLLYLTGSNHVVICTDDHGAQRIAVARGSTHGSNPTLAMHAQDASVPKGSLRILTPITLGPGALPLMKDQRFSIVDNNTQDTVRIRFTTHGYARDIHIPRQDVRIEQPAPPEPITREMLKDLDRHLSAAGRSKTEVHETLIRCITRHKASTEMIRRLQALNIVSATLAADIAETVIHYQALCDNVLPGNRSVDILREALQLLLETHADINKKIQQLARSVQPLEDTVTQLDHTRIELHKLDSLLSGREDKLHLLVERGQTPEVLQSLKNVEINLRQIDARYVELEDALDKLPRKHADMRRLAQAAEHIEQQQKRAAQARQDLQARLGVLRDIMTTDIPPRPEQD